MSTRRAPGLKERTAGGAASASTSSDTTGENSPPKNSSSSKKRSLFDNGRLCLLQKGRGMYVCWGIFLMGAAWISSDHTTRTSTISAGSMSTMALPFQEFSLSGDRILHQPIVESVEDHWKVVSGIKLYKRANYQAKPLVMGFLLVPTENYMLNYYQRKKHRTKQPPKNKHRKGRRVAEDFQLVRIHPEFPQQVDYLDNQKTPLKWNAKEVSVPPMGDGEGFMRSYRKVKPDPIPDHCEPQYEWQVQSFPNCIELHTLDIPTRILDAKTDATNPDPDSLLLARGGYRETWKLTLPTHDKIAMKTLLYERDWTERNTDRHRRDALATDRLGPSPYALNLFGYCSNTGLYEFANGGSLENAVDNKERWSSWTPKMKLKYAYQVALAIADVHNIDHEGTPSMSHTDISMSQFVSTDGGKHFRINDFNRARFLMKEKNSIKLCPFTVASNKGKFRAPEEYAYEPETAAIDTYSMGNIFYVILTGHYPFENANKKTVQKAVQQGQRPDIPTQYLQSDNDIELALIEAMKQCWIHSPQERATSRQIQEYLKPLAEKYKVAD